MSNSIDDTLPVSQEPTARQIAEWMVEQMSGKGYLYQEVIVYQIIKVWGKEWTYRNNNGNPAISKDVLKEFRKLTEETVVWERGERAWRPKRPNDKSRGAD
ncbi:DUF6953 family protein [Rhizobium redzepovicii]|uniref:DUF6953 family protein n=1 Tax=Rhizobium redzepovicii TaxID=2867518 RepID=UPI001C92F9D3|nr:hypothetical protein [Rhizobium redzepovicii]MBY4589406.1 hypothetical protein [Rhizobium redzepovicii]